MSGKEQWPRMQRLEGCRSRSQRMQRALCSWEGKKPGSPLEIPAGMFRLPSPWCLVSETHLDFLSWECLGWKSCWSRARKSRVSLHLTDRKPLSSCPASQKHRFHSKMKILLVFLVVLLDFFFFLLMSFCLQIPCLWKCFVAMHCFYQNSNRCECYLNFFFNLKNLNFKLKELGKKIF